MFKSGSLEKCEKILMRVLDRYELDGSIPIEKTYSLLITVFKDRKMPKEA